MRSSPPEPAADARPDAPAPAPVNAPIPAPREARRLRRWARRHLHELVGRDTTWRSYVAEIPAWAIVVGAMAVSFWTQVMTVRQHAFADWESLIFGGSTDLGTVAGLFMAREAAHRGTPTWGAWLLSVACAAVSVQFNVVTDLANQDYLGVEAHVWMPALALFTWWWLLHGRHARWSTRFVEQLNALAGALTGAPLPATAPAPQAAPQRAPEPARPGAPEPERVDAPGPALVDAPAIDAGAAPPPARREVGGRRAGDRAPAGSSRARTGRRLRPRVLKTSRVRELLLERGGADADGDAVNEVAELCEVWPQTVRDVRKDLRAERAEATA